LITILSISNHKRKINAFVKGIIFVIIVLLVFGFVWVDKTKASPPYINYQGKLFDSEGLPVSDGQYNMEFKLYTGPTCDYTSCGVWTETRTGTDRVTITGGLFSILLGKINDLSDVDFNQSLYLGVNIGGSGATPSWDGEMIPRKRKELGSVPYALSTYVADVLDNLDSTQFVRSDVDDEVQGFLTVTKTPAGTGYGQGSLYIQPASAAPNYTVFGVSVGGSDIFKIEKEM